MQQHLLGTHGRATRAGPRKGSAAIKTRGKKSESEYSGSTDSAPLGLGLLLSLEGLTFLINPVGGSLFKASIFAPDLITNKANEPWWPLGPHARQLGQFEYHFLMSLGRCLFAPVVISHYSNLRGLFFFFFKSLSSTEGSANTDSIHSAFLGKIRLAWDLCCEILCQN